jgi:hypothetical protein
MLVNYRQRLFHQPIRQEEITTKAEEISRLKLEIRRLNDSLNNYKNEKLGMVKKITAMEEA